MSDALETSHWQVPSYETHAFTPRATPYCVCVPVINEGERIIRQLREMHGMGIHEHADVIICDGGSTDGSTDHDFLRSVGARTLLVKTGPGKLSAQLRMGYAYALREGYAGIITIDGNDKDGPEAIPAFIEALEKGVGYVQGSRFVRGGQAVNTPLTRYLAIRLLHAPVTSLGAGHWLTDTTNGFRGYSRDLLLDERVQPFRDVFDTYELLAYLAVRPSRLGYEAIEIPVTRRYPPGEKTPTKIKGLSGNLSLLRILFNAALGRYNPGAT